MALLDVNALVALAWDSHVHHAPMRRWFADQAAVGWETCPITEGGFVRVSTNPRALPVAVTIDAAFDVLRALRATKGHAFVANDVSITDGDVPRVSSHSQVTDALLLALARRQGVRVLTFDRGLLALGGRESVKLLTRE